MQSDDGHLRTDGGLKSTDETELPIGKPWEAASRESATWRCRTCGEIGRLEEHPECAAPREELFYWEED